MSDWHLLQFGVNYKPVLVEFSWEIDLSQAARVAGPSEPQALLCLKTGLSLSFMCAEFGLLGLGGVFLNERIRPISGLKSVCTPKDRTDIHPFSPG